MAAAPPLSKAEYLKRYLSGADAGVDGGSESGRKRRKKRPKPGGAGGKGMRIVDDDVSWTAISTSKPEKEEEEDDGDLPVVAEFVDERPEEVKQMEAFRSSAKWKLLGGHNEDLPSHRHFLHDTLDSSPRRVRHDTPDSSPRRARHDTPDSSPRRARHDTPDPSPLRGARHDSDTSPPRRIRHDSSDTSPPRRARHDSPDPSPPRRPQHNSSGDCQKTTDSDLSSPRHKQSPGHQDSDSDLSPPRNRPRHRSSDSDLSPPRRRQRTKSSDSDLSPPRRCQPPGKKAAHMYSGAKTGLVLTDIQREQQELKKQDQETMAFEAEFQYAETVFRDKSGRKRNLKLERLEQRRKAEKDSERDELYAQWGKGLAQSRQQQQNVEDAVKEMQKPLARYIDDEDLDRMLREQEREGDPMANFIKKNKAKENKNKKVRPRYSGPAPPPNRFNIWPGYRWDGVDRSNGFEQKRFARLASKKAVEELAYKWSVEDM
ncbi:PREDICTED: BUD13 homolog isoform X2 [Colobus angolensis palliatus]|uniref:BUD13 homolog isoform X2 n=1 Tax=Colobus angolensis palliatus TaxID=336983 RepID=UPI0005F5365B|nr:PREDICTED: BUD13 homolog isoform X2 [Colobus angolensis palliatus]